MSDYGAPGTFAIADLWEAVAATVPDRTALKCADRSGTYAELDARANRLAGWMTTRGVGKDDFVGVCSRNSVEYVEATLAAFKLRAVPVNVNFRYVTEELRCLFDRAQLVGVVHDAESRSRVAAATTPRMRWTLEIGDDYEASLASVEPPTTFGPRSNDDLYVIYTGGTTGAPKGVRWRMEDAFHACLGGGAPQRGEVPITTPGQIVDRVVDSYVAFPVPPLMHASGMWPTLRWLLAGGTVVLVRDFDPDAIWRLVEIERVNLVNIVADAMARPLFDALRPDLDLSSLAVIGSSGAPLSRWMNRRLAEALPGVTIRDIYGSSETGVQGWSDSREDDEATGLFEMQDTIILDPDTLRPIPPGSEATGRIARRDTVPLGYHDDLDGSLDTFVVQDGRRIALTGDLGRLHADGRVSVLGRGSSCINSGGEKIYPAEVENVLRSHPTVYDIVVVGVPDARWGEAVAAVIQPVGEADISEQVLRMYCADRLASYKVPKSISFVDSIERSAAGKPDVEWAKVVARRNQEGCEQ